MVGVCSGARPVDEAAVLRAVTDASGLAPAGIAIVVLPEIPRLSSGKVDHRALVGSVPDQGAQQRAGEVEDVCALYARLLGRDLVRPTDSFVGLGGDSLSYVEASLRLERLLGHLPAGWPALPIAALVDTPVARPRRGRLIETNVLLRALAILTIVGSHANLFALTGGAHVLLAVVGFNFGRFQVSDAPRAARVRGMLRGTLRIVVPSVAVIGLVAVVSDAITWRQALLVTAFTEWSWSEPGWSYWFIEALVLVLLALSALLAIPAVDRLSRRWPFGLALAVVVASIPLRYDWFGIPGDHLHRAHGVLWLVALGWAIAKARTARHRWLVTALTLALVPGFFAGPSRSAYVIVGLLLLAWLPQVRVPGVLARVIGAVAGASLWIYLLHWRVYPTFETSSPVIATMLSLVVGVVVWRAVGWVSRRRIGLLGNR